MEHLFCVCALLSAGSVIVPFHRQSQTANHFNCRSCSWQFAVKLACVKDKSRNVAKRGHARAHGQAGEGKGEVSETEAGQWDNYRAACIIQRMLPKVL